MSVRIDTLRCSYVISVVSEGQPFRQHHHHHHHYPTCNEVRLDGIRCVKLSQAVHEPDVSSGTATLNIQINTVQHYITEWTRICRICASQEHVPNGVGECSAFLFVVKGRLGDCATHGEKKHFPSILTLFEVRFFKVSEKPDTPLIM